MEQGDMTTFWQQLEQLDVEALSEQELIHLHQVFLQWRTLLDQKIQEVAAFRSERWWQQLPPEDARTIRLLLKGAHLTPQALYGAPELNHLLLLTDLEDPNVARMWASLAPEVRQQRIEELRQALSLTEMRRTTTVWEDDKESTLLAYELLGVSSHASFADVRQAYRTLVTTHHPDKGGDPRLFKAIQKAYRLLESRYL